MISAILMLLTIVATGLPLGAVYIPWTLITGDVLPLYRISFWVVRTAFWMGGVRVRVEGLETIPPNVACIFMANHVSNLDPPVLLPLIPGRTAVFLKQSLMRIPVLGYAMKLAEFVPVSRDRSLIGAQESTRLAIEVIRRGTHITTFVEGTRSPDGRLLPFKKGPFYLAMETGAPCIPVSISGTETMMRKGSMRIQGGTARVIFHPPIYPTDMPDRQELMHAVRDAIEAGLPERMRTAKIPA
jgi:1-acyl-sn-glycerol-3-phosphate acyltransferase